MKSHNLSKSGRGGGAEPENNVCLHTSLVLVVIEIRTRELCKCGKNIYYI